MVILAVLLVTLVLGCRAEARMDEALRAGLLTLSRQVDAQAVERAPMFISPEALEAIREIRGEAPSAHLAAMNEQKGMTEMKFTSPLASGLVRVSVWSLS